jgi:hypothetical protein
LIVFVPAVFDPLIDAAAHIEQPKRIWLQAADLDRLVGGGMSLQFLQLTMPAEIDRPTSIWSACRRARHIPIQLRSAVDTACGWFPRATRHIACVAPAYVCNGASSFPVR